MQNGDNKEEKSFDSAAISHILGVMGSEEKSEELSKLIKSFPDEILDHMARSDNIPEEHFHIHRAMMRGENNTFIDELSAVDGLLHTGDIILMTGNNLGSKALAKIQKTSYKNARSSHVALVHADFVCIDAIPIAGATNRIISEVLFDVEDNWRIIRHKQLKDEHRDKIARACVYYLAQPYKILPSTKEAKSYAYCSELARKVYTYCGVKDHGIPNNLIIKPANFDRLADHHSQWLDVTESVRPAIDFCKKYPELIKVSIKIFTEGLKLNRKRFEDRKRLVQEIQQFAKDKKISQTKALEFSRYISEIENQLNHVFWDVGRKLK